MNRIFIFLLNLFFIQFNFCVAQNTTDSVPPIKIQNEKLQLGIFFSPDYCNQVFKPITYENSGSLNNSHQQIADTLNSITNSAIGYSAGLNIICAFNKKLSLKTGIYLAMKSMRYNGFIYRNGIYYGNPVFHITEYKKEKSLFLQFPLAVNYTFSHNEKKKVRLSCFGGGILSINCNKSKIEIFRGWDATQALPTTEDGFTTGKRKSFSTLYVGVLAGANVDYKIGDYLKLNIQPTFKYFPLEFWNLSKGSGGGETLELPWSVGCSVGVSYCFY